MDYIFGTLSTVELKRYRHLLQRRGVQHAHEIEPRIPMPNQPITLKVRTGVDFSAESITAHILNDNTTIPFEKVNTEWDTIAWGYITHWQATLPGYTTGTSLNYQIVAKGRNGKRIWADFPDIKASSEAAALRHFMAQSSPEFEKSVGDPADATTFTLPIGLPSTPKWAHDAIIYHVFVDRFYPGDGKTWHQPDDLLGIYGGTLRGVQDKLDYIADLGANTIWLSPIFPSPSHHGYDATDYRSVEPRLGTEQDLRDLITAMHERGMRVLFDLACNHLYCEHPIFLDALNDENSPYRDWFTFDDSALGYRAFFNVADMPEVNLANPAARDWMIENALYWLREFDVDGYRLDYANGPTPSFWAHFNWACKQAKPDCWCFGEVIDAPDQIGGYIGRLDGLLDFQLNDALRKTFGWQSQTRTEYADFVATHWQHFPSQFVMPAFIDNHDMNRFMTIADNDGDALLAALEALLELPNPPVIYYGTEIGLTQENNGQEGLHLNRVPMRWGEAGDVALLEKVRGLVQRRKARDTM